MKDTLEEIKETLELMGFCWEWKENDGIEKFVVADKEEVILFRQLYEYEDKEVIEYKVLSYIFDWVKGLEFSDCPEDVRLFEFYVSHD